MINKSIDDLENELNLLGRPIAVDSGVSQRGPEEKISSNILGFNNCVLGTETIMYLIMNSR